MNLIDKDVLLQRINTQFWSEIENIINSAPSIDIVRCKECKKNQTHNCAMWFDDSEYKIQYSWNNPDDYCSWGESECELWLDHKGDIR